LNLTTDNTKVALAAGTVGTATLLSRIFGYIRDMVIASVFGAGMMTDVFIAAFRVPNFLRRLFGEGSLAVSFIPVFSEYITKQGESEAFKLAAAAIRLLFLVLSVITLLGVLAAPFIVKALAYGFIDTPEKYALTVSLTRIMFPYVFFIGMVALFMGVLNVLGHFAAPALAPVLLNLAMITSVFIATRLSIEPVHWVYGLAIGVVSGGILQLMLQLPFLVRKGITFWHSTKIFHPGLRKIGLMFLPATFGAAVLQINSLIGNLLASFLPEGSISYLYFADRLVQFPLGVVGIPVATAVLPAFSRQAATSDLLAIRDTFVNAVNMVLSIIIPAMVGLIVLRSPIVTLLFQRGAFSEAASRLTADAILYYAIGLWAFATIRIVAAAFYAQQDVRTPVRCAVIAIGANVLFGVGLAKLMGHSGIALALSLSAIVNLALLLQALKKRLKNLGSRRIIASVSRIVPSSFLMGAAVWAVSSHMIPPKTNGTGTLLIGITTSVATGLIVYAALSFLMRTPEFFQAMAWFRKRS
jgi:putative peptidoglycan lipid II flippase